MPREKESRVKVHSKLTVVSSTPVGPGKTHPLGALDHSMGLHSFHWLFYYGPGRIGLGSFHVDRLLASLSEALSQYPAITGRLTRPDGGNWEVRCNDAGVRVHKATVRSTLDEWLRSADGDEETHLTVWEDMPEDPSIWPPFRIQVNDFVGGGVAIGLSCTHLLQDPVSAALLLKAWTATHRGEPIRHPPAFLPTTLSDQAIQNTGTKSAISAYAAKAESQTTPFLKMATSTFRFSNSAMEQCLSQVHAMFPDLTPFDFLVALFWMRVARLRAPSLDNRHTLSVCMDLRKLEKAKLPLEYFGNALHFSRLSLHVEELDSIEVRQVAARVHHHVSGLEEGAEEEIWSDVGWLESRKGEDGKFPPPFKMYGHEFTCVDMENLVPSIYADAMFEKDEKLVHAACRINNVGSEGLIMVMPSPEEGLGRTVAVTLPEEQMGKLREDEAMLNLGPTMSV